MRTVESQITSVYPSQTNFVVEASFTWDHDVTLVYYGSTTVTLKAGEHLPVDGACFRPGGTKITAQISSGSYPVGLSACKCATIEMYDGGWQNVDNRNLYEGATVHLKADIEIDGNGYLVPMGSFKVYEVETVHEVTTLTCYDAMKEADVLCPTEMQGEHNYIELWRLAATRLGLTPSAIDDDLGYNALGTVDAQHTIRQVIEAIALACGGNAVVSGDALYVRPITSTADVTLTQWINQLEVASTPVEVTGVRVKKTSAYDGQERTYFYGAGGYVIELNDDNLWLGIEGPSGSITVAAEAVAETVYEQLKNKPIYKFSGDLPADPRLDIFDKVIVKDLNGREYPSIITEYTFVFSGKTSIGNSVESSSSYNTSDSGPSGSSASGVGADYIVAQGTTGAWTWRMWSSGVAEMWSVFGTDKLSISSAWGSLYYGTWMDLAQNADARKYPFAFAENPAVNASYMGGGGDAWLVSLFSAYDDLKTSAPAYALARPNQGTISNPRIAYYVVGKYK
nr:MAG TPA: hypothetical protein [Caudoviricetes sp.]